MSRKFQGTIGLVLLLAGVWIGPYSIERFFSPPSSLALSAGLTTMLMCMAGTALFVEALIRGK